MVSSCRRLFRLFQEDASLYYFENAMTGKDTEMIRLGSQFGDALFMGIGGATEADAAFIAACSPDTILVLIQRIRDLEAR